MDTEQSGNGEQTGHDAGANHETLCEGSRPSNQWGAMEGAGMRHSFHLITEPCDAQLVSLLGATNDIRSGGTCKRAGPIEWERSLLRR